MYNIIYSCDQKYGFGYQNDIPWKISEDLTFFKDITTKTKNKNKTNAVIMGRKTYESIPKQYRPLKNRINIVLSNTINHIDNVIVLKSVNEVLIYIHTNRKNIEKSFVIGGLKVYEEFFNRNLVTNIYENFIHHEYMCDKYLNLNLGKYKLVNKETKYLVDTKSKLRCNVDFNHYRYKNIEEENYLNLMRKILTNGSMRIDRTGVGTLSTFGECLKYDIRNNKLPLLTTKLVPFRLIVEELLWFISGDTNAKHLQEKKVRIWDGNTTREFLDNRGLNHLPVGDIGAGYGFQLRHFNAEYKTCNDNYEGKGIDQLEYIIDLLKNNPTSRRILFSYWNPSQLNDAALPPCHLLYQFYVNPEKKEISCCLYQRSSDYFLANNYNAISAIVLTHMLGQICGYKPVEFTHFMADTHIYLNHIEQCREQIERETSIQPYLEINPNIKNIHDFQYSDFKLINYYPQKAIRGKMN
jgi:dihydrofolate reductase/thymidylate synthase